MQVKGAVAIVTGGASGLGRGTALSLLARGARVAIFDVKRPADASNLADALFVEVDITDEAAVAAAVKQAADKFGAVHVCVNCAGVIAGAPVIGDNGVFPIDLFRRTIDVNLTGSFIVLCRAAEQMARNAADGPDGERGVIVNTASIAAFDASSSAAYAASKGGVASMTLTIARDLARHAIRVNAIAPGFMDTDMFSHLPANWIDQLIGKTVFPKRLGAPAEFGELVCHIVENRFMNASVIRFDAGSRV